MKAVTVRIPWPLAICYLGKPCENSRWQPSLAQLRPGDHLAIHAGKMISPMEIREAFAGMYEMEAIDDMAVVPTFTELLTQESAIVAVVTYSGAVTSHPSNWFVGPKAWTWSYLIVLPEPVKCRGAQGLWNVPPDVLARMRAQFNLEKQRT
jgi:hypothetical protein